MRNINNSRHWKVFYLRKYEPFSLVFFNNLSSEIWDFLHENAICNLYVDLLTVWYTNQCFIHIITYCVPLFYLFISLTFSSYSVNRAQGDSVTFSNHFSLPFYFFGKFLVTFSFPRPTVSYRPKTYHILFYFSTQAWYCQHQPTKQTWLVLRQESPGEGTSVGDRKRGLDLRVAGDVWLFGSSVSRTKTQPWRSAKNGAWSYASGTLEC